MGDDSQTGADEFEQGVICDVSSGHNEQASRRASQQMAVMEVSVFRDDDPILCIRDSADLLVGRLIAPRKRRGVNSLMTVLVEQGCEADRQLCVYEEPRAAPGRSTLRPPAVRAPNSSAASRSSRSKSG